MRTALVSLAACFALAFSTSWTQVYKASGLARQPGPPAGIAQVDHYRPFLINNVFNYASGVCCFGMRAGGYTETKKLVLLR